MNKRDLLELQDEIKEIKELVAQSDELLEALLDKIFDQINE